MATDLTPTTELEAVNFMLGAIGQSPVNTLELSGDADVATARSLLRSTSREFQTRGWFFNKEQEYPLALSMDNKVPLPTNALFVDPDGNSLDVDAVQRGLFLYDRANHTYTFDKAPTVTIVFFLDYSEMPEAARWYVAVKAARRFHDRTLGAELTHKYVEQDEVDALASFLMAEVDMGDYNMFTGSYSVASALQR